MSTNTLPPPPFLVYFVPALNALLFVRTPFPAFKYCVNSATNYYNINGRCLRVENSRHVSWFKAREGCKQFVGGDLVSVDSAAMLAAIDSHLTATVRASAPYWIGLLGRKWMWQDGRWAGDFIVKCRFIDE